ncbi:MAG TPA: NAD-dependent epimerase/dehydratase family protein [Candidatus Kapabacteria bacterium]|nr:NAD-dependent epimerase/dehydratase family protein [Candidatus Kapabacteria bacterium]
MHILVTGGAGFIGSHVVDVYLAAGHRVSVLDNFRTGDRANCNPAAELYETDMRDRAAVADLFRRNAFDLVNHHAAQLDVRVSVRDPQFDAEQNIIGTLNVLEAARAAGTRCVIFSSSGGTVYGDQLYFPADEDHPTNPVSPYGITKLAAEKYLHYYHREYGFEYVVLRYTNVYGPRQSPHGEAGVVAIFCDRMFAGARPVINGPGEQTRDYVFVTDVARANLLALDYLEHGGTSGIVNICSGLETSVNTIFRTLNALFGDRFAEHHGPAKPGEQERSVCSFERASRLLGWTPRVRLREGMERTLAFYRERKGPGLLGG